jgi:flagellar motor switch protein FliN/FliY
MAAKKVPTSKKETATPKKATASRKESAPAPEKAPPRDNVDLLDDLQVMTTIELGRTWQTLEHATSLDEQSLIELDKQMGDPVDIKLNGKLFARGEVVTVNENFGVRITEIIGQA